MTRSIKTMLGACAAAAALFVVPAGAQAGTLTLQTSTGTSLNLLSSPHLDCPSSSQFSSTSVADAVVINTFDYGTSATVWANDATAVGVLCSN